MAALRAEPPSRKGGKWRVSNGTEGSYPVNPDCAIDVPRVARLMGCEPAEIRVAHRERLAEMQAAEPPPPPDPGVEPEVIGYREGSGQEVFPDLASALASDWPLLRWADGSALVALDIDCIEGSGGWTEEELDAALRTPGPRPRYAWRTRSGGLRLVFGPCSQYGLTPGQRAGLSALLIAPAHHVNTEQVELLCYSRNRPKAHPERRYPACDEYSVLDLRGALLRTGGSEAAAEADIEAWLAEQGMRRGERYGHEKCPHNPGPSSGTPPVRVLPDGIQCHKARCMGFRPWSRLLGPGSRGKPVAPVQAALKLVHWAHASVILEASRPDVDPELRRLGYEALLAILHPEDDTRAVWRSDLAIVRGDGYWMHAESLRPYTRITGNTLNALPWVGASTPRRDLAASGEELDGYPPLDPVLWLVDRPTWGKGRECIRVRRPVFEGAPDQVMSLEDAQGAVRHALPGVPDDWQQLVLGLVVAGLFGQAGSHTPPQTLIHGESGCGKGAAVSFASGVLGVQHCFMNFSSVEELRRSIGEACEVGSAQIFGDEINKVHGWHRLSEALFSAADYVAWRKLYHGNAMSRNRQSFVYAASSMPTEFLSLQEFARRCSFMRLPRVNPKVSFGWKGRLPQVLGVSNLARMRHSPTGASIADAILREALRIYRENKHRAWVELAPLFGMTQMGEDEASRELRRIIRELYDLWLAADPGHLIDDRGRKGWLRCWMQGHHDEAAQAFQSWVHPDDPPPQIADKLLAFHTADVVTACGVDQGAQLSVKAQLHGRRWAVRFVAGSQTFDRSKFPRPA